MGEQLQPQSTPMDRRKILGLLGLAILVRLVCLPNRSYDYMSFLDPWYEFIQKNGGLSALKHSFSDYTPAYLYWLVIASTALSWLPKLFSIKLFAIAVDFVCGFFVYHLVKLRYPTGNRPLFAFFALLFAPTIWLNSALWGQCDVLYTTGLVACLYFLCIDRKILALIAYGISFSFKLQSIFMAPFLFILFLKKRIQWWMFSLIFAMYFLLVIPAWYAGRPLKELLLIYFNQATQYKELTKMAPNIYQWISNQFYDVVMPLGIALTLFTIAIITWIIYRSRVKIDPEFMVTLAFTSVLVMPFLLPKMHDRYFFPADVISIIFAFYFPQYLWMPIVLQITSIICYANGDLTPLIKYGALFVGMVVFFLLHHLFQRVLADDFKSEKFDIL
jgi:Gpi18-like mannosyltransferase